MSSRILELFTVKGAQEALSLLAGLVATAGLVFGSSMFIKSDRDREMVAVVADSKVKQIIDVVDNQRVQIDALNRFVDVTSRQSVKHGEDGHAVAIAKLEAKIQDISRRESDLEKVIINSPVKSLEIPILRRDIDNIKEQNMESIRSVEHSTDRLYDLNKYVILTIFASIVLLAISTFIKAKSG
jgi:hypothetical protein